jgi:NADH-quinone oxidoreductase subunit J
METAFYIVAGIAVLSTIMVITRNNATHALLYMIVSLLSVALIFFILGAPFVAAMEVIIYAGAIIVLFVFVVMLLNLGPSAAEQESEWMHPKTWRGPALLAFVLGAELMQFFLSGEVRGLAGSQAVGPKEVGISLMGPYLIGLELASFLLLAALIGAYHLGWRAHGPTTEAER